MENGVEQLFASLEAVEAQRPLLGDIIEPTVTAIHQRIRAEILPPTDADRTISQSWQTLTETSQALGLETPEPPEHILSALLAVTRYETVLARLGSCGLAQEREATKPDEPTVQLEPVIPKISPPESVTLKPAHDISPKTIVAQTPEKLTHNTIDITDPNTIKIGEKILVRNKGNIEVYKQALVDIIEALTAADDQRISITDFLKQKTGTTSRFIQLVNSGNREKVPGVDYEAAQKYIAKFYGLIAKLKKAGIVEHSKGSLHSDNTHKTPSSGMLKLISPTTIQGLAPNKIPYHLTVNLYEQSIDNGKGRRKEFRKTPAHFKRLARALGYIAAKTIDEQARFTRSSLSEWMSEEPDGSEETESTMAKLTTDLIATEQAFDGDFPLKQQGIRGGSHFKWLEGSTSETIDGFLAKPRFDEPVYVSVSKTGAHITVDGVTHAVVDYSNRTLPRLQDLAKLEKQNRALFEALSILGRDDQADTQDIAQLISQADWSEPTIVKRLRTFAEKVNSFSDEPIINWRPGFVILLDLNRRIILVNESVEEHIQPNVSAQIKPATTVTPNILAGGSMETSPTQAFLSDALVKLEENGVVPRPQNAGQAIGLLDLLGNHRAQIAKGKTREELEALVTLAHRRIQRVLTDDGYEEAVKARSWQSHPTSSRAFQTSGSSAVSDKPHILRTDAARKDLKNRL